MPIQTALTYPNPSKDFVTHLHYLQFLEVVSRNLTGNYNKRMNTVLRPTQEMLNKEKLINFNLESIEQEVDMANTDTGYARLLAVWLPVKGYYAAYHLMCFISCLDNGNLDKFNQLTHLGFINQITQLIKSGAIDFNNHHFNRIEDYTSLDQIKVPSGSNLANLSTGNADLRCTQILKMATKYKIEDLRRNCGGTLRTVTARQKRAKLNTKPINLFEILYWYRIRANYKDLDIIEENLADSFYLNYINSYYKFLRNYTNALKDISNQMITQRGLRNNLQFAHI